MAITITQGKKKQRYLLMVLALVIFAILAIIWLNFGQKSNGPSVAVVPQAYALPKINIDWQLLENMRNKTPQPFEEISAFTGDFGRNNPFIPY